MQLRTLSLVNFRRFKGIHTLELHRNLTVLAANNGGGKSSILDAIALAFGPFLTRLPKVTGNSLSERDICLQREKNEHYAAILALTYPGNNVENEQNILAGPISWNRVRLAAGFSKALKTHKIEDDITSKGIKEINALADYYIEHATSDIIFPILAYYGTGRAILEVPQRRRGFGKEFSRFHAYSDCLNPKTNFRKLFEYFYFLEDLERREREEKKDWEYRNGQLEAIRRAIISCVPEYSNPRTRLHPLRFLLDSTSPEDDSEYDIQLLSDGFKTTIAMVMDIAIRMVEANPDQGPAALNGPGIVLIDEIELHLHPSWQQRIIPDLLRTFPNVQFICTTHSPQVLSTVPSESIRTIGEDGQIAEPNCKTYGAESKRVLEELMGVNSRPPVHEKELREFIRITDAGDWTSPRYQELRALLVHDLGETDPLIIDADIKKNFQELEVE